MADKTYRIDSDTVVDGTVTAKKFIGPVEGAIEEAIVAERDQQGQVIDQTYIKSLGTTDGSDITTVKGDDTAGPSVTLKSYAAGTGLSSSVFGTVDTLSVDYGNTADTACEGNDVRLSDAREPLPHDQASSTITSLTGYVMAQTVQPISTNDSLNEALGKLEKGLSMKQSSLSATSPITIEGDAISHAVSGVTPGTYTKITVDGKGHATAGAQITLADLQMTDSDLLEVMQQQVPVSNPNEYNLLMSTGLGTDYTVGYVTKSAATSKWVNGKGTILSADVFKGDIETDHIAPETPDATIQIDADTSIGSVSTARTFTHYGTSNTTGNANVSGNVTIGGNVVIDGDLLVREGHIEHYEDVYVEDNYIFLRDGATAGLPVGSYSGFQIKLYDGTNDGRLVIDNQGVARVGDVGDEQPLLTRAESANMIPGAILKWDGTSFKAISASSADVFAAAGFTFTTVSTDE